MYKKIHHTYWKINTEFAINPQISLGLYYSLIQLWLRIRVSHAW